MSKPKIRDARFKNRPPAGPTPPKRDARASSAPRPAARPRSAAPPRAEPSAAGEGPSIPWNAVVPGLLALGLIAGLWTLWRDRHPAPPAPVAVADAGGAQPNADAGTAAAVAAPTPSAGGDAGAPSGADQGLSGDPVNPVVESPPSSSPDPRGGRFSLAQATEGLEGSGPLRAEIETSMGTFSCALLSDAAPIAVANFVGLARGTRDFWDPVRGAWVRRPFYDGSIFHRVIPDFMIQGGDILRSGRGGTGYEFADENVRGHNAPGQLCMANRGPNTNGGQFFITERAREHLDGSYTIFGRCTPEELVGRIARVPRDASDRPEQPVFIRHVRILRGR